MKKIGKYLSEPDEISGFFGEEPLMAASVRLTKACNLRCPHCYANGGLPLEKELSFEELKKVIDEIAELGALHVFYTGGEPFTRKDLEKILRYNDKRGLGILLSTNAQLVTEEKLEKLKDLNFKLFQVSLDGPRTIHDSIRGNGVWENATKKIKLARKILGKNIGVGTVMMKKNFPYLGKILEDAADNGADIFALMFLIISGRATESLNPTPKEYLKALHELFGEYQKQNKRIKFAINTTIPPALVPASWRKKGLHWTFAMCSFPYCLGVESNGDVAPCDGFFNFPEMILGNVRKDSIKDIWRNSKLLKEIRAIKPSELKGVCSRCKYRDYCAGGCRASAYSAYKDLRMPDPACQTIYEAGLFPKDCLVK